MVIALYTIVVGKIVWLLDVVVVLGQLVETVEN